MDMGSRVKAPFKYHHFWSTHPDFLKIVSDAWHVQVYRCAMFKLYKKLKSVQAKLKEFNKKYFSEISCRTTLARTEMENAQQALTENPFDVELATAERH